MWLKNRKLPIRPQIYLTLLQCTYFYIGSPFTCLIPSVVPFHMSGYFLIQIGLHTANCSPQSALVSVHELLFLALFLSKHRSANSVVHTAITLILYGETSLRSYSFKELLNAHTLLTLAILINSHQRPK